MVEGKCIIRIYYMDFFIFKSVASWVSEIVQAIKMLAERTDDLS